MKSNHELDDRKMKILQTIIKTYLETGDPVGSRTISKYTDLNLSSATIAMRWRIWKIWDTSCTSHIGRSYSIRQRISVVCRYADGRKRAGSYRDERTDACESRQDGSAFKAGGKVLAANTNYATMISAPTYNRNKLKFIQLSQVDENQIIAVIVMEGNIIKNKIVTVSETLSNETLLKLNMLLNTNLNGMAIEEINLGMIARLKEQAGIHSEVISDVLDAVANTIQLDNDLEIYTSGATNIFKYPELSDNQSAQEIISAFEEKQQLAELVTQTLSSQENKGIQVYIGNETPVQTMKDCSVVTATYELGEGMQGTIGIIGPKRMDYENVMTTLKTLMVELDAIFHKEH